MTREEIINRENEINEEINRLDLSTNTRSKEWKRFKELCEEHFNLKRELDKLDGKTYDSEKWITKYRGESYVSLKDARLDLIKQIKDLHGVEIDESNPTGVVAVKVYTEYKVYYFTIHAHYRVEIVREWEEEATELQKKLFGEKMVKKQETRQIFCAWCEKSDEWSWRY